MAVVLRSLILLGLTGASLALFVAEIRGGWLNPFVSTNAISLAIRQPLLAGMAAGFVLAVLVGLLVWRDDDRRLWRLARLARQGSCCASSPLCTTEAWTSAHPPSSSIAAVLLMANACCE